MKAIQFKRCEIVLHSNKEYANPFADVDIDAVFTHEDGTEIKTPGFWNGENEWKVRFISEKTGVWNYKVISSDGNESLCDEGTVEVEACADKKTELQKHGFVRLEEGKRYMVYGDGTPFFYLADTHWQMPDWERLHECNYPGCNCGNQFKHLADDRIKKGFNVYQTYFDSAESDGGGNVRVHHWWSEKYTKINPQAFNETMDEMIEYLADNGITVALGFGVHCGTPGAFGCKAEPLLAFTRYCVARYSCYPIIWITAQEITNNHNNAFPIWKQVGALVGELDGYHRPNGAHMHVHPASYENVTSLDAEPWHQVWAIQAGHGGVNRLQPRTYYQGYYELPSNKVMLETECFYEDLNAGSCCGNDAPRMGAWNALLSGCTGYTYGAIGVWALRWSTDENRGWPGYSPEPWYVGMDKPASGEMKHLKKFFEYVKWYELEPSFGFEYGDFEMRKYVSIAHKGTDLFVYYFFGDSVELEVGYLKGLKPNTRYQARWFDPINGKFIDIDDITTPDGRIKAPAKPNVRDWALLLNTYDLGEYETIPYPNYPRTVAPFEVKKGDEIKIAALKASTNEKSHETEKMLDGDPDTYWCPLAPRVSVTLTADLGTPQDARWFYMKSNSSMISFIRYRVYGSNDNENYELITERPHPTGVGIGGPYKEFYDVITGTWRYIKIVLLSSEQTHKLQLTDFKIFK